MRQTFLMLALIALLPSRVLGQTAVLQPSDISYKCSAEMQTDGNDTTFTKGLTSRVVAGQVRLLSITLRGVLQEWALPACGTKATTVIRSWDLGPTRAVSDITGIWWDDAKQRLWIDSAVDYTATNTPAHIVTVKLNDNGTLGAVHKVNLPASIPERRVFGGAAPSPVHAGKYVVGFGGYTSLVRNAGGASIGPTMYEIDDPDGYANGATIPATVLLDAGMDHRGVRVTKPWNYFDGGDPRQNPSTRPSSPPASSGAWLSPNAQGLGWMTWGDSYYNTGMYVDTGGTRGWVAIMSGCGVSGSDQGRCWYQSSTLAFDGRVFEFHIWDPATLTNGPLTPPTSMVEIKVPGRGTASMQGDTTIENFGGATWIAATNQIVGTSCGGDASSFRFSCDVVIWDVRPGTSTPPPSPVDAVVSAWSAWSGGTWSDCAGGQQTRVETRTRTVTTPAHDGGMTPALSETRTASQACTVTPPPVEPPTTTVVSTLTVKTCRLTMSAAKSPDGTSGWKVQFSRNPGVHQGRADSSAPYGPMGANLDAGTYHLSAVWTKTGQPTITQDLGTVTCR